MRKFQRLIVFLLFLCCAKSYAQSGCTDPLASNYDAAAVSNNGSCVYPTASVTPFAIHILNDTLPESSGLICWNDYLWTHNDNTDTCLYALDTSGHIQQIVPIRQVSNQDWEEVTQDDDYFYIGDFGNNANGDRQNLHIFRISKTALGNPPVSCDTIWFHYSDQLSFTPTGGNHTDFDCEALIVGTDSLYLFTKQWISKKTKLYAIPKHPGNHEASLKDSFDVQGLITGAAFLPDQRLIALCGYNTNSSTFIDPFVFLFYDYKGTDFFSGNKRKIMISQPLSQIEGIATRDGLRYYLSNEKIVNAITIPPRLEQMDLSAHLGPYLQSLSINDVMTDASVSVSPNPAEDDIMVTVKVKRATVATLQFRDTNGKICWTEAKKLSAGLNKMVISPAGLSSGTYWLNIFASGKTISRKIIFGHKY